jgi:hypothetical protein
MFLKDRFEILNIELLSVFGAVEELTLDERVVHTQSRKLSTDAGLSTEITTEAPSRHNTTTEQLDFSTLDAHVSNLSSDEASNKIVQILRLRGIYNMLCDASQLILSMYQMQFLLNLIPIFVEITACLCAALKYITKLLTCQLQKPSRFSILCMLVAWGTINLTKVTAITASCHGASQKARQTAVLVHNLLLVRPLHPGVKAELQVFSQQLLHRKLEFNVCGLFPIDFTLLYSLAGAVTTYFIILLQHSGQDIDDLMVLCNKTFLSAL